MRKRNRYWRFLSAFMVAVMLIPSGAVNASSFNSSPAQVIEGEGSGYDPGKTWYDQDTKETESQKSQSGSDENEVILDFSDSDQETVLTEATTEITLGTEEQGLTETPTTETETESETETETTLSITESEFQDTLENLGIVPTEEVETETETEVQAPLASNSLQPSLLAVEPRASFAPPSRVSSVSQLPTDKNSHYYFDKAKQIGLPQGFNGDAYSTYYPSMFSFRLNDSTKGKAGVRYRNVGYWYGTPLDLEVIVDAWGNTKNMEVHGTYTTVANFKGGEVVAPHVCFGRYGPNMFVTGTDWIRFRFTFYKAGTEQKVAVTGHGTATDIDAKQGVRSTGGIDHLWIRQNSPLKIDTSNGKVYDTDNTDTTTEDRTRWVSFDFNNVSEYVMTFYCGQYEDRVNHKNATKNHGYANTFDVIQFTSEWVYPDNPKTVSVQLKKTDSSTGAALSGATFALDQYSVTSNSYVFLGNLEDRGGGIYRYAGARVTSDNQGMFRVREVSAPPGYTNAGYSVTFHTDDISSGGTKDLGTVTNDPVNTTIVINKKSTGAGRPGVAGAVYRVYSDAACQNLVATFPATDSNGQARVTFKKTQNTYYVKEYSSPAGFMLDTRVYTVAPGSNSTYTLNVDETPATPLVSVAKLCARTTGATYNASTGRYTGTKNIGNYKVGETVSFDVIAKNVGNVTCNLNLTDAMDANLTAALQNVSFSRVSGNAATVSGMKASFTLAPGESVTFRLTGVVKNNGYSVYRNLRNNVSISGTYSNGAGWYAIPNRTEMSDSDGLNIVGDATATLIKSDSSDNRIKVQGATYGLYNSGGTLLNGNLVTDSNGSLTVQHLDFGSYYFKEISSPAGYVLNTKTYPFSVSPGNANATQTFQAEDDPDVRKITITKRIKKDDVNSANGYPSFTYSIKGTDTRGKAQSFNMWVDFSADSPTDGEYYYLETSMTIPAGNYTVVEGCTQRYYLERINIDQGDCKQVGTIGDKTEPDTVRVTVNLTKQDAKISYWNKKGPWDTWTHSSSVTNHLPAPRT